MERFYGDEYDLIRQNCNHFSEAYCQALVGKSIPPWVNRLANFALSVTSSVHHASYSGDVLGVTAMLNQDPTKALAPASLNPGPTTLIRSRGR